MRLLSGFPLTDTGNPIISLVSKAQEIRQGPAESRWVARTPKLDGGA